MDLICMAIVQTYRRWVAVRTPRVAVNLKTLSCAASVQRSEKLMTIRGLASAILTAAVRRASPGVREWGTAMLREMDFVESDWAALLWAIGSVPVLFKHSEAPMIDPSEVFSRAQALMKKVRRRTLMGYGICLFVTVYFASLLFTISNTLQGIGWCLSVAATLYMAYQLYKTRNGELPSETRPSACTDFYRAELQRQRDFHRGIWLWSRLVITVPSYFLFAIGLAMAHPEAARGFAAIAASFIVMGIVAVPLNLRLSRRYQRQMDELDALPKTRNTP
jgi:hypothetical protein